MIVAGVDGCPGGWAAVIWDGASAGRVELCKTISDAAKAARGAKAILVDMPIGLGEVAEPGGRECERAARRLLAPAGKASSVFSAPPRSVLDAATHAEAVARCRASSPSGLGLSAQTFNIFPKIREMDDWITPGRQRRVRETHPELCFAAMAGAPLRSKKRTPHGRAERLALLEACGLGWITAAGEGLRRADMALDDLYDAGAACWSAWRLARGEACRIPGTPGRDARGLRMEMVY